MADVDFTALVDILEKDIVPAVYNQLYKKALLWEVFSGFKAEESAGVRARVNAPGISFANNKIYITLQNGRPVVSGVNYNGGEKFTYGTTPTDQGELEISNTTAAFLMPKAVMKIKDSGTIVDKMQFNIKSTVNAMAMDLSRQAYSDGSSTLAYVAASGTSTTVTLKPKATASTLYNNDIPLAVRYFAVGLKVKIGANAVTTVTGITGDNTITVADSQTLVADTAIVKNNDSDATAPSMTGLQKMVSASETYMGITVASNATWKATEDTNSGSAKTYADGDWDASYFAAQATGNVNMILCNKTEFQKYGQAQVGKLEFASNQLLSGGWKGLDYMGGNAMVILDYDCPDDRVYLLSPEHLFRAEYQGLEFETGTLNQGARLPQQLDFEIVADIFGNIGTTLRSAHAVLTNRVG